MKDSALGDISERLKNAQLTGKTGLRCVDKQGNSFGFYVDLKK